MKKLLLSLALLFGTTFVAAQSVSTADQELPNIFTQMNTFNIGIQLGGVFFNQLGTPAAPLVNGLFIYCKDCALTNPCAGAGAGTFARGEGGVFDCGGSSGGGGGGTVGAITTNNP